MTDKLVSGVSRRQFLTSAGVASAAALFSPRQLFVQYGNTVDVMRKAAASATIAVKPLRNNISVLMGSGGNIAVLTGKDGKMLIDAGFAVSRTGITSALASINADPINHLINTHWHVDHTDANEWLHAAGAEILAQVNTRKHLSTTIRILLWETTFPPVPSGALPTAVFDAERAVHLDGETIAFKHSSPPIPTATSLSISPWLTSYTSRIPDGTATIRSSTTLPPAASMALFELRKQISLTLQRDDHYSRPW